MKFGKTYSEFIEKEASIQLAGCSYVEFKKLKKVLKRCPMHDTSSVHDDDVSGAPWCSSTSCSSAGEVVVSSRATSPSLKVIPSTSTKKLKKHHRKSSTSLQGLRCPSSCPGCDAKFFGELMEELSEVVGTFNARAEQLVKLHMATGLRKFFLKGRKRNHREAMIQEGQVLVNYASMNAIAVRKILKKYDKVHRSREGGLFKSRLMSLRSELLKSPYLVELGALHLNLNLEDTAMSESGLVAEFSCDFESSSPSLTCTLVDSAPLVFELSCSICLETFFDPVSLGCGHLFCNNCVCTAVNVLGHEGPRAARCNAQCPMCRQTGVYADAVKLKELSSLIKGRRSEEWHERFLQERKQQLKLAKEFYDHQMEALLGMRNSMLNF